MQERKILLPPYEKTEAERQNDREEKSLLLSKGSHLRKNKIEAE